MYESTETIEEREHDGKRFRARIHLDPAGADCKPDGDFFGYVFTAGRWGVETLGKAYNTPDTDFRLATILEEFGRDWDDALLVLQGKLDQCMACGQRIERDAGPWVTADPLTNPVCDDAEEGDAHEPLGELVDTDVVGLDYISRQDHDIVNVVTKQDLEIWGWTEDHWPTDDNGERRTPTYNNLVEWEAWADGDVWFYTIEKAVTWTTEDEAHDEDLVTWDEVDACHGYYGDEYVREAALESLDTFAPKEEA